MLIRKICFRLVAIMLLVVILDLLLGAVLRHFYFTQTSGFQYRTTFAMERTNAEILVFGSSRASHHYVPDVFEKQLKRSFYNVGRDGQGILFHTAVLKSIVKRYNPKVIILEYYEDFENLDGSYDKLAALAPYYRNHPEIREIVNLKGSYEKFKLTSNIYPYNSELLSIAIGNAALNKLRNQDFKGYSPLFGIWQETIKSGIKNSNTRLDENKIRAFKEFLMLAKASGATVMVVDSPVFVHQPVDAGLNLAKQICAEYKVEFLDHTQDSQFIEHRSLFKDISHLNNIGAEKFSEMIARYIGERYRDFALDSAESGK